MTELSPRPADPCSALEERVEDLVAASATRDAGLDALRAHAEACAPCTELLEQQRMLENLLGSLAPTPVFAVPLPALPAERVVRRRGRLLRMLPHAAAAAILAAAAVGSYLLPGNTAWETAEIGETVAVQRVVTRRGAPTLQDERLVALTSGWEAVALRRPTERR